MRLEDELTEAMRRTAEGTEPRVTELVSGGIARGRRRRLRNRMAAGAAVTAVAATVGVVAAGVVAAGVVTVGVDRATTDPRWNVPAGTVMDSLTLLTAKIVDRPGHR